MSEVRVNNLSNEKSSGGPTISGITTHSGRHFYVPPQGDTASRPQDCPPGSFRFNTDTAKLEYFRGNTIGWQEIEAELTSPLGGGTAPSSNMGLGIRGLYAGGTTPTRVNTVDFLTIATLGDSEDFGDLPDTNTSTQAPCSNTTRGIFAGGYPYVDRICFFTFASKSDSTDFGNLTQSRASANGVGDGIRGVFVGGYTGSNQTTMDYITVAQTGDAKDFGDLTAVTNSGLTANSTTRGLIAGINNGTNRIDFITIRSTGNAADFGDLTVARSSGTVGPLCNATRGVMAGGYSGGDLNVIDYVTIATQGSSIDFGDLYFAVSQCGAASSPTRGVIMGGIGGSPRAAVNISQKIEILSTGNSVDFGDVITARNAGGGISNGHGGLG